MSMLHISTYKEKFDFYWGQRKYKLSLWGVSPHFDWIMALIVTVILFIAACVFGFGTYRTIDAMLHTEVVPESYKKSRINLGEIQKVVDAFERDAAEINSITK